MICDLPQQADPGTNEIIELARSIEVVVDPHSFIDLIVQTLNMQRPVCLNKIVGAASISHRWAPYVAELREWINARRPEVLDELAAGGA